MDTNYINIFNMDNPDVNVLHNILIKDLEIMNYALISPGKWRNLKYDLLKYETLWEIDIFIWSFDGINIHWDALKNQPSRYFQIHAALEACWEKPLALIWDEIDNSHVTV